MKVAFVTSEYPPKNVGGAGISSKLIVDSIRERDIDIDVYSLTGDQNTLQKKSKGYYELPHRDNYRIPSELGENVSVIKELPDLDEYDITHCYNTGHLPATVLRSNPPVLATVNNHMWVCVDPTQFLKEGEPPCSLRRMYRYAGTAGYTGLKQFGRFVLECGGRSVAKRADAITVQTQGMKQVLEKCGYSNCSITVVPNIVDPDFISSNSYDHSSNRSTIIFLGRLVENKGASDVTVSFANLPRSVHQNWKLEIYGIGPQESLIQDIINKCPDYVDIELKYAPYHELPDIYQKSDVMIHASKYTEPFSRTWLEAMASETPIICSRNPSSESVLSGIAELYDPFDEEEPRRTMKEVLCYDDLSEMSRKGKDHSRNFLPEKIGEEYIKLYNKISN